jgi:hypothetical protein
LRAEVIHSAHGRGRRCFNKTPVISSGRSPRQRRGWSIMVAPSLFAFRAPSHTA